MPRLVVDCRGLAARDALPDLRGVRGEMVVVRSSRRVAGAAGAPAASAHAALHRAARRRRVHDRRDHDRKRAPRPVERALGRRAAERRLCAASGVRRGRDRRARRRPAAGLSRQPAAAAARGRVPARSTACSGTVSCWRRRWRRWRCRARSHMSRSETRPCGSSSTTIAHDVEPGTLAAALECAGLSAAARSRPR